MQSVQSLDPGFCLSFSDWRNGSIFSPYITMEKPSACRQRAESLEQRLRPHCFVYTVTMVICHMIVS